MGFLIILIWLETGISVSNDLWSSILGVKQAQVFCTSEISEQALDSIAVMHSGSLAVSDKHIGGKWNIRVRVCRQVQKSSYGCEVFILIIELLLLLILARMVGIIKCYISSHHGGGKWTYVVYMKHLQEVFKYKWFDGEKYSHQVSEPLKGLGKK